MAEKSRLDALYADKAKADFISSVSPPHIVTSWPSVSRPRILFKDGSLTQIFWFTESIYECMLTGGCYN